MKALQPPAFDYGDLPVPAVQRIQALTTEISAYSQLVGETLIELGRRFREAQELFGNRGGEGFGFQAWVEQQTPWSIRTVYNLINIAKRFENDVHLMHTIPRTVLNVLAAPSTPDAVVHAVVSRVEEGQTVSLADVEALKREAQQERETRQLLAKKLEQAQRQNQTLDLNLQAASEREQRSYRELLETQEQIATLAAQQAQTAIEQARLEMQATVEGARQEAQAAQQRVDELRQQLRHAEEERKAAIQRGVNYNLAQRQEELNKLERDIQYAETSLASFRQKLKDISSAEYENQRLNIDAEKVLREIVLFGTTLNLYESEEIFPINWGLLEQNRHRRPVPRGRWRSNSSRATGGPKSRCPAAT